MGDCQPLARHADDLEPVVEREQRAVDQLLNLLRHLVGADARVEVVGRAGDGQRDDVERRVAASTTRRGERQGQQHGSERSDPHQLSASRLRSASSVRASSGVRRFDVQLPQPRGQPVLGCRGRREQAQLLHRLAPRAGHRRPSAARQLVLLEAVENLARARDHAGRQARQARDLDAVAAIRSAGHDLAQEHDLVVVLAGRHVVVHDARQGIGQVGQLVVVRGKQRLRPRARVRREVLGDGPGDAQPVEGRRAAADLVEHDEAARGRQVQDARRLLHLHHEGGLPARDVV